MLASADEQGIVEEPHWQSYDVPLHEPYIGKQIYWTESEIDDHVDAFPSGTKLPQIEPWDGPSKYPLPTDWLQKCQRLRRKGLPAGEEWYRVWAKLQVRVKGLDVRVVW